AAQSGAEVVVPPLTQLAALPAKDEKEPVVFETERELVLVPAWLDSLLVRDDAHDRYADYSDLLDQTALPNPGPKIADGLFLRRVMLNLAGKLPPSDRVAAFVADVAKDKRIRILDCLLSDGVPMFSGNREFDHFLFIGLNPLSPAPVWKELRLKFVMKTDLPSLPGKWQWMIWNGLATVPLTPASDSTGNLARSGEVVFADVPAPLKAMVHNRVGQWLRLSWAPLEAAPLPAAEAMPIIQEVNSTIQSEQKSVRLVQGFLNNIPLDMSKDFYPFGTRPAFGDTLYLASPLFSPASASVTLHIQLTNPAAAGPDAPLPPVKPNAPKLKWEFWDGMEWKGIGTSEIGAAPPSRLRILPRDAPKTPFSESEFLDATQCLTQSGEVRFGFPSPPVQAVIGGKEGFWIRVRLASGDYGREIHYELHPDKGYVLTPATFAPPVIRAIQADQSILVTAAPSALLTYNDLTYRDVTGRSFPPFEIGREEQPCCYLGLQSANGTLSGRSMSFYVGLANPVRLEIDTPDLSRQAVMWDYWDGATWQPCAVQDDSGLRHSGLIRFLTPQDFSSSVEFGRVGYWLRVRKVDQGSFNPKLRRVLLNTTMVTHTQTTAGEVLGSGTGKPHQTFRTARRPVLEGQILEVLEPSVPSPEDRKKVEMEEGAGAITETPVTPTGRVQAWVRWHEMPNFERSGPRDRHYVIDRDAGQVMFGDAVAGMAPPALTGNVRMALYRTGGGSLGNKPAASIVQLKTTVPYVERVTNFEAADGGADIEPVAVVLERAPREIRHRDRAVTFQDFEDLAKRASSEVARAKCLPLCDLEVDRTCQNRWPGVISLVVAPRWADGSTKPQPPSAELFRRVREFLDARRSRSKKLVLAAPDYVRIDVKVEITVAGVDTAVEVQLAVARILKLFLHPMTGFHGSGWDFGRLPAKSDLYALVETVSGVNHVRALELMAFGEPEDAQKIGRFLVYGGDIQVAATLEM
ncbi:MAG: putative baseplate assembly protein, partial [Bryobacteraceae bacterium]